MGKIELCVCREIYSYPYFTLNEAGNILITIEYRKYLHHILFQPFPMFVYFFTTDSWFRQIIFKNPLEMFKDHD